MKDPETFVGLFFGPLPEVADLEAVVAEVVAEDGERISTVQPLCCRELLFTETKILCSPRLEDKAQLVIVGQKSIFHSQQFQRLLEKLHLKVMSTISLSQDLFQYCLYFTIYQRLAPLWNKAGQYFVKGRDFLLDSSKMDAITWEITLSDKICFALKAFNFKLPPCKVEHFSASSGAIGDFYANESSAIGPTSIHDDLCLVLPSLKKGRLVSISHHLPKEGPFSTYEELRKHWKVMYGYRLPAKETVFYNVNFYYIKNKVFTYPGSCIRSREPAVSARCDQQSIFSAFLNDLYVRVPSICGAPFRLVPCPMYPVKTLHSAASGRQSNLTRKTPSISQCRPFGSFPGRHAVDEGGVGCENDQQHAASLDTSGTPSRDPGGFIPGRVSVPQGDPGPETHALSIPGGANPRPRLVPHFTARRSLKFTPGTGKTKESGPTTPLQQRNPGKLQAEKGATLGDQQRRENGTNVPSALYQRSATGSVENHAPRSASVTTCNWNRNDHLAPPSRPALVTKHLPTSRPGLGRANPAVGNYPGVLSAQRHGPAGKGANARATLQLTLGSAVSAAAAATVIESEASQELITNSLGSPPSLPCVPRKLQTHAVGPVCYKRKADGSFGTAEPCNRKPRSKPQVQDLDIKQLAYNNQLNKANSATLIDWLKKHGVAVKSKDKKGEMVDKVKHFLGLIQGDLPSDHRG